MRPLVYRVPQYDDGRSWALTKRGRRRLLDRRYRSYREQYDRSCVNLADSVFGV